jgi:DNA primase
LASLPPNFLDELRARTPIAAIIGRSVRLTRSGREQKGCCPFHGEKTPSFYVYDDHFHCFGCGEHGDVISFLMKSTGAGFIEAVETLAAEAGLEVPKATPQAAEAEARRASISEVLDAAATVYQKWLFAPDGKPALDYLRGRGLTDATIQKFRLGWSGEGKGALAAALRPQGITTEQLIEAGLMKQGDFGPADYFFSRVMFPIWDRRGKIISFGGRIMGDGQPKYVNGPETPAFSKRRSLYGLNFAREAVRTGKPLIVVEGYMDVIALAQAGFTGAVAPLGTALTEDHLADIWRLAPEPVICFDADAAGRRAALRTVDLALSALAPDRGLKFLRLPEKEDPDSIIKREGAAAFAARLSQAQPLSALLFDMLAEGVVRDTPERRASFHKRLVEAASRIPDKALAGEYRSLLLGRFFAERRPTPFKNGAKPSARSAMIDRASIQKIAPGASDAIRGHIMTAILLAHPKMFPDVEEAFAQIPLPPSCARLRDEISNFAAAAKTLDTETLFTHLSGLGLAEEARLVEAVAAGHYRPDPELSPSETAKAWWSFNLLMDFRVDLLRSQRDEQQRYWETNPDDPAAWARLKKYNELLARARHGEYESES